MAKNNPKLKVLSTEARGIIFDLTKDRMVCGRAAANDLVLNNASVSGKHCSFILNELGFTVKDEGSTNGTFVNNIKIKTRQLKDEDIVSIGSVELLFDAGYLKQKRDNSSGNKSTINLGENHTNIPLTEMQNFSPFANKKNPKLFIIKKMMFFISLGLVAAAVGLLIWILLSSIQQQYFKDIKPQGKPIL